MTKEQIEAARGEIVALLMQCFDYPMRTRIAAKEKLDALCAQAHLTAEVLAEGDFAGHTTEDFDAAE